MIAMSSGCLAATHSLNGSHTCSEYPFVVDRDCLGDRCDLSADDDDIRRVVAERTETELLRPEVVVLELTPDRDPGTLAFDWHAFIEQGFAGSSGRTLNLEPKLLGATPGSRRSLRRSAGSSRGRRRTALRASKYDRASATASSTDWPAACSPGSSVRRDERGRRSGGTSSPPSPRVSIRAPATISTIAAATTAGQHPLVVAGRFGRRLGGIDQGHVVAPRLQCLEVAGGIDHSRSSSSRAGSASSKRRMISSSVITGHLLSERGGSTCVFLTRACGTRGRDAAWRDEDVA